jgi:hypothetical protein
MRASREISFDGKVRQSLVGISFIGQLPMEQDYYFIILGADGVLKSLSMEVKQKFDQFDLF